MDGYAMLVYFENLKRDERSANKWKGEANL